MMKIPLGIIKSLLLAAVCALACPAELMAQSPPPDLTKAATDAVDPSKLLKSVSSLKLQLKAGIWATPFNTTLQASRPELPGTAIKLNPDLGAAKYSFIPFGKGSVEFFDKVSLGVEMLMTSQKYAHELTAPMTFNGIHFLPADTVNVNYSFTTVKGSLGYFLEKNSRGHIAVVIGVDYISASAEIADPNLAGNGFAFRDMLPYLGVEMNVITSTMVDWGWELSGTSFAGRTMIDAQAYVDLNISKNLAFTLGIRAQKLDMSANGMKLNSLIAGPFTTIKLKTN